MGILLAAMMKRAPTALARRPDRPDRNAATVMRFIPFILPGALLLFIGLAVGNAGSLLVLDEIESTFKPGPDWGHPPLFPWILLGAKSLFGETAAVFRLTALCLTLVGIYFLYLIAEKIQKGLGKWTLPFYLALPTTIQGSVMIDFDPIPLTTALLGTLVCYLHFRQSKVLYPLLFLCFLVVFFAKTTTVYALVFAICCYELIVMKRVIPALLIAGVFLLSRSLFFESINFLSTWAGPPYLEKILAHNSVTKYFHFSHLLDGGFYIKILYYGTLVFWWVSPFFWILLGMACWFLWSKRKESSSLLLVGMIVPLVLFPYLVLKLGGAGFPKYVFVVFSLSSLLIAAWLKAHFHELQGALSSSFACTGSRFIMPARLVLACLLLTALFYFVLKDPLLTPYVLKNTLLHNPDIVHETILFQLENVAVLTVISLLATGVLFPKIDLKWQLLLLCISYLFSLNLHQLSNSYNTRYNYGETGYEESVRHLLSQNISEKDVFARRDIIYHVSNRNRYWDAPTQVEFTTISPARLAHKLSSHPARYLLIARHSLLANRKQKDILARLDAAGFKPVKTIDSFMLYRR